MRFITPVLLLVISGLIFFLFVDPQYRQAKELRAKDAEYTAALYKTSELRNQLEQKLAAANNINAVDREKLVKMLPNNIDNVQLILDLDNIASRYGLVVRNIKVDQAAAGQGVIGEDNSPYGTVRVAFTVSARYEDFKKLLDDLEHSLRLIDIETISFSTNNGPSAEFSDYAVGFKTYWLK